MNDENTPLLSKSISSEDDPVVLYVKAINGHLPWYKRPSSLWLVPIFGLTWVSSGMLASSTGQFHASLLCREYLNRHTSNTTLIASEGSMVPLRPGVECQAPEIQAFTAEILALVEVLTGIASGVIVRATSTILTIVYIDFTTSVTCLLLIAVFIPESLPARQPVQIRRLYEKSAKKGSSTVTGTQERVAWHSHASRSLSFFKPNGRNTNLILLAAIAFLQMLSYRGTLSVIILYTNRMFKWTEYEAFRKKQSKSHAKASSGTCGSGTQLDPSNVESFNVQAVFNPNNLDAVSSVQNLGEAALDLALDEDDKDSSQESRTRQISVDSIGSLASNKTAVPSSPQSNSTSKKGAVASASNPGTMATETRTKAQAFSDMKFDTWMIRLGLAISAITYVGYGLASEGWVFYIATALHAISIISSPSQKSLMTGLVEPSQFGAVLGAIQVVESIAAIFSPIVISWVYALTVKSMPEFVWYSCAAWATICVVLAFMIRQKQFRNNVV
ncbi:hypothetical protein BGX26_012231 [Mortierella sp. AD094]|nr:hypothetical protein BGX26_012231 [Mortierella sp. AD094]